MKILKLLTLLIYPFAVHAGEEPSTEEILELCHKMALCQVFEGAMDIRIGQLKRWYKDVPKEYWDNVKVEYSYTDIIKLYKENFNKQEIQELNKIYDNEVMDGFEKKRATIISKGFEAMKEWHVNFDPEKIKP